eukprot:1716474-Amphidinium_carterae.1
MTSSYLKWLLVPNWDKIELHVHGSWYETCLNSYATRTSPRSRDADGGSGVDKLETIPTEVFHGLLAKGDI